MAKDVNLTSQEWCDIVFEEKNKAYGAYNIRRTSSNRHLIALIVVLAIAVFITFLPFIVETVKSATATPTDSISTTAELTDLDKSDPEPEQPINNEPPPPPTRSTIQFTPPVLADKEDIADKNKVDLDELAKTDVTVGTTTHQGTGGRDADMPPDVVVEKKPEPKKIVRFADRMPEYPGGEAAMREFIGKNLEYPEVARKEGIDGTVSVQFVVNENGSISNIVIKKSPHQLLSDEATRVIKKMPKWIPGEQAGVNVAVYFSIPIVFRLN